MHQFKNTLAYWVHLKVTMKMECVCVYTVSGTVFTKLYFFVT